jgi:hypothetical protein
MAIKKYTFLVAMLVMLQIAGNAQSKTDWGWDWKDSSKVPTKSVPQYNEFLNNQFPYPAKPKNQWELGFGVGTAFISGDLTSKLGVGFSVSARKSISHVFSLRPSLAIYRTSGTSKFAPSYQTNITSIGIDGIASLNTINSYSGNPKINFYILSGFSVIGANVKTRPGTSGSYTNYRPGNLSNLITTLGTKVGGIGTTAILPVVNAGSGVAFKINDKTNFALEFKASFSNYDYLDGYTSFSSNAFDALYFTSARLNINLGTKKGKRVQPLNWINPNNYVYNELNSPKHMKMPKVVLVDADKDGVTDQFDLEPNTPAGAAVDSHGVAKDSDSDGVPDFKDKELLTSQKCFPVNADGIGNCPEAACCTELRTAIANIKVAPATSVCAIASLPSIQFKRGATLTKDAENVLASAAGQIKANSDCKVKVIGYVGTATASKAAQQLSYDRVSAVIKYLVEKQGISESRLLFFYGENGDANTVDLLGTTEDGPNTVPAPHPNLRSK